MGWQGYDNEGCMPGDKELSQRLSDEPPLPVMRGYTEEEFKEKYRQHELNVQHERLKDAVVHAAKLFNRGSNPNGGSTTELLCMAVEALERFEQEQSKQ